MAGAVGVRALYALDFIDIEKAHGRVVAAAASGKIASTGDASAEVITGPARIEVGHRSKPSAAELISVVNRVIQEIVSINLPSPAAFKTSIVL